MFMNWKLGTTSESSFKGSQITSEMRMLWNPKMVRFITW
jgi:hypothetical protein